MRKFKEGEYIACRRKKDVDFIFDKLLSFGYKFNNGWTATYIKHNLPIAIYPFVEHNEFIFCCKLMDAEGIEVEQHEILEKGDMIEVMGEFLNWNEAEFLMYEPRDFYPIVAFKDSNVTKFKKSAIRFIKQPTILDDVAKVIEQSNLSVVIEGKDGVLIVKEIDK